MVGPSEASFRLLKVQKTVSIKWSFWVFCFWMVHICHTRVRITLNTYNCKLNSSVQRTNWKEIFLELCCWKRTWTQKITTSKGRFAIIQFFSTGSFPKKLFHHHLAGPNWIRKGHNPFSDIIPRCGKERFCPEIFYAKALKELKSFQN